MCRFNHTKKNKPKQRYTKSKFDQINSTKSNPKFQKLTLMLYIIYVRLHTNSNQIQNCGHINNAKCKALIRIILTLSIRMKQNRKRLMVSKRLTPVLAYGSGVKATHFLSDHLFPYLCEMLSIFKTFSCSVRS